MKKLIIFILILFVVFTPAFVLAEENDQLENTPQNTEETIPQEDKKDETTISDTIVDGSDNINSENKEEENPEQKVDDNKDSEQKEDENGPIMDKDEEPVPVTDIDSSDNKESKLDLANESIIPKDKKLAIYFYVVCSIVFILLLLCLITAIRVVRFISNQNQKEDYEIEEIETEISI